MVIKHLEKIYEDSFIQATTPHSFNTYMWFFSPTNTYLGIEKHALDNKDRLLLEAFLQKVEENQVLMTEAEKWWHAFLLEKESTINSIPFGPTDACRLIHFQFSEPFSYQEEWKEALTAFFDSNVEVIWENATSGTIIEIPPAFKSEEAISFSDIVDTTASDFFTNVKLYVGSFAKINEELKTLYEWEKKCFILSLKARKTSSIHTFEQAIPYLVTGQLENELVTQIKQLFVSVLEDEKELLQSIKIYIENNLNVSLTAKKLFMHRNSLQYRIDKFIERTGIDIKNFQGALAAYLAIIILESES